MKRLKSSVPHWLCCTNLASCLSSSSCWSAFSAGRSCSDGLCFCSCCSTSKPKPICEWLWVWELAPLPWRIAVGTLNSWCWCSSLVGGVGCCCCCCCCGGEGDAGGGVNLSFCSALFCCCFSCGSFLRLPLLRFRGEAGDGASCVCKVHRLTENQHQHLEDSAPTVLVSVGIQIT